MSFKKTVEFIHDSLNGQGITITLVSPDSQATFFYPFSPDSINQIQSGNAFACMIFDVIQFLCEAGYMPRSDNKSMLWDK